MEVLIQLLIIILIGYKICSFFRNLIRYALKVFKSSESIFDYKGNYIKSFQMATVILLVIITTVSKVNIIKIYFNYMIKSSINDFINYRVQSITHISISILVAMIIVDFLLKEILDVKLYEDGILYSDGKFILWSDVKFIEYRKNYIGKEKDMIITIKNNKKIFLKNRNKNDFEELKAFVFTQSGMIVKDIAII